MRECRNTAASALVLWLLVCPTTSAGDEKPILAVVEFEDRTDNFRPGDLAGATDFLRGKLVESGRYRVVDKTRQGEKRAAVVKELRRASFSPCYDRKCRVRLGRALAADTMLACAITAVGKTCILGCEITRLDTEAVSAAASTEFSCKTQELLGSVKRAAAKLCGVEGASRSGSGVNTTTDNSSGDSLPDAYEKYAKERSRLDALEAELAEALTRRQVALRRAWEIVAEVARDRRVPEKTRREALHKFLMDYPSGNPHRTEAECLYEGGAMGKLVVRSSPPGARALLGGTEVGSTPLHLALEGGEYDFVFSKHMYFDTAEEIAVDSCRTNSIDVSLQSMEKPASSFARTLCIFSGVVLLLGGSLLLDIPAETPTATGAIITALGGVGMVTGGTMWAFSPSERSYYQEHRQDLLKKHGRR